MDERVRSGRFLTSAGGDGLCGRSLQVRTTASLLAWSFQHSLGKPRGAERNRAQPSDASRSREEPSVAERHFPEPRGASPRERNWARAAESSTFPQFSAPAPSYGPLNPFPRRRNPTRACAAPSRPRPRTARPRPQAILESCPCGARAQPCGPSHWPRRLPVAGPVAALQVVGRRRSVATAAGGGGCAARRGQWTRLWGRARPSGNRDEAGPGRRRPGDRDDDSGVHDGVLPERRGEGVEAHQRGDRETAAAGQARRPARAQAAATR